MFVSPATTTATEKLNGSAHMYDESDQHGEGEGTDEACALLEEASQRKDTRQVDRHGDRDGTRNISAPLPSVISPLWLLIVCLACCLLCLAVGYLICLSLSSPASLLSRSNSSPSLANTSKGSLTSGKNISSLVEKSLYTYTVWHRDQLGHLSNETKFVVHKAFEYYNHGMGNRLGGMISCLLLAILTDRVFIWDWEHAGDPLPINDLFAPPPIDPSFSNIRKHYTDQVIQDEQKHKTVFVINEYGDQENKQNWEQLLCNTNTSASRQFLYVHTNQYWVPLLWHNAVYQKRLIQMGFEYGKIGHVLLNFLLKLSHPLQLQLDEYRNKHFAKDYNIGIQIRTRDGHQTSDKLSRLLFQCAEILTRDLRNNNDLSIAWHLVTDNEKLLGQAVEWTKPLSIPIHQLDCPVDYSPRGLQCAVLNMWLLASTDDELMSKASTFGDIPHAISGIRPVVTTNQGTCFRQLLIDPCFHHWQYVHHQHHLSCATENMLNVEQTNGWCVGRDHPL